MYFDNPELEQAHAELIRIVLDQEEAWCKAMIKKCVPPAVWRELVHLELKDRAPLPCALNWVYNHCRCNWHPDRKEFYCDGHLIGILNTTLIYD